MVVDIYFDNEVEAHKLWEISTSKVFLKLIKKIATEKKNFIYSFTIMMSDWLFSKKPEEQCPITLKKSNDFHMLQNVAFLKGFSFINIHILRYLKKYLHAYPLKNRECCDFREIMRIDIPPIAFLKPCFKV